MKTRITSFSTRFIGLFPIVVIVLITALGNPDLFKKKQQNNWLKAQKYSLNSQSKTIR
ncbi:hypothetical protein [Arcicella rigui]|uniref:Uncharacterized protein n=1 Tax=Arcicella rigui TaxID=797020 RepID=A0ABU5Q771_9BACT|nr:hypothetical protein [Arcicella rigui]MEA5138685.1 hypothetical protein [Arcicella rigui]